VKTIEAMKQAKRALLSPYTIDIATVVRDLTKAIKREEAQSVEPYGWLILSRYQGQSVTRDICIGLEEFNHRAKYWSAYEYMGDDGIPKYKDGTDTELGWNAWCSKPLFTHPAPAPTGERDALVALCRKDAFDRDCPYFARVTLAKAADMLAAESSRS